MTLRVQFCRYANRIETGISKCEMVALIHSSPLTEVDMEQDKLLSSAVPSSFYL